MGLFDFLRRRRDDNKNDNAETIGQDAAASEETTPIEDTSLRFCIVPRPRSEAQPYDTGVKFARRNVGNAAPLAVSPKMTNNNTGQNNGAETYVHALGAEQQHIYNLMENTNDTMFITGKAGTGKSYLLWHFKKHTKKKFAVVAPTWMAAINVEGQSINSFFVIDPDIPVHDPDDPSQLDPNLLNWNERLLDLLENVEVIIIDEVSMVRADVMDMIDRKIQLANNDNRPFGGKQIIMFGDPYQLPPVVDESQYPQLKRYLKKKYGSEFFFSAPVFKRNPMKSYDMKSYELSEVFRQKGDDGFIALLNKIRTGEIPAVDLNNFNRKCRGIPDGQRRYLTLTPYKAAANYINNAELGKLPGQEFSYDAIIGTEWPKDNYPADETIRLKLGALVVMLENNSGGLWYNGTLGIVNGLSPNSINVRFAGGVSHPVSTKIWEKRKYYYDKKSGKLAYKVAATFVQYPIKLAWAITIHKAQGQTYKSIAIDMGYRGAFECGQAYVALSRCKSIQNLHIIRDIKSTDIIVNSDVKNFMKSIAPINTTQNQGVRVNTPNTVIQLPDRSNDGEAMLPKPPSVSGLLSSPSHPPENTLVDKLQGDKDELEEIVNEQVKTIERYQETEEEYEGEIKKLGEIIAEMNNKIAEKEKIIADKDKRIKEFLEGLEAKAKSNTKKTKRRWGGW